MLQCIIYVVQYDNVVYFRWIKFEEDVEEGGERWSKPFVATLALHSLFELRKGIMTGTIMLDLDANSLPQITGSKLFDCHIFYIIGYKMSLKYA